MNRIQVLNAIWGRSRGDNVYLPMFQKGKWHESDPFTVEQANLIIPVLAAGDGDRYFTPLRYNGPRRRAFVGQPGVIFADLDSGKPTKMENKPSVLIETSPGHFHGYWFLDKPYDAEEWEPHAKGWSTWLGADPGGWDVTQVLRFPDSLNHKTDPPEKVRTVGYWPDNVYPLNAFPVALVQRGPDSGDRPLGDASMSASILNRGRALGTIPMSAIYWLVADADELKALGTLDRSKIMWGIERSLFENGFSPDDVFHLMRAAGINKWAGDDDKLWHEVQKAGAA